MGFVLRTKTDPVSEMLCFQVTYLEFRVMDNVLKPSDSESYASPSGLFIF
jgi:hypothetical protein